MPPVPMVEELVGEDKLDVSYVNDSIDEDKSVACITSAKRKSTLNHAAIMFSVIECNIMPCVFVFNSANTKVNVYLKKIVLVMT